VRRRRKLQSKGNEDETGGVIYSKGFAEFVNLSAVFGVLKPRDNGRGFYFLKNQFFYKKRIVQ
jgi:hypothetical protein